MRAALLTITALMAFAANSVFCRIALQAGAIDAAAILDSSSHAGDLVLTIGEERLELTTLERQ